MNQSNAPRVACCDKSGHVPDYSSADGYDQRVPVSPGTHQFPAGALDGGKVFRGLRVIQ